MRAFLPWVHIRLAARFGCVSVMSTKHKHRDDNGHCKKNSKASLDIPKRLLGYGGRYSNSMCTHLCVSKQTGLTIAKSKMNEIDTTLRPDESGTYYCCLCPFSCSSSWGSGKHFAIISSLSHRDMFGCPWQKKR